MPPSDTPLNKAHQHASNAEDYINQGLLILAAEEHYKSAEAFIRCVEQASDEGTKRTLRMLYNEHTKSGKELQRKIVKLKDEGKDPSLPQLSPPPPPPEPGYSSPTPGVPSTYSTRAVPRGRMSDSNHTIDESYMVLGQQSDPSDTFNQFWKALEGMLDNLSQPVAFATAPLARLNTAESVQPSHQSPNASSNERSIRREGSSGSDDTDFQVGLVPKYNGRTLGLGQPGRENRYMSTISSRPTGNSVQDAMEATIIPNTKTTLDTSDPEEVLADDDSPSGESFFMIPSATDTTLVTKLRQENASLKRELTSLEQQLETAERMRVAQEQQIRDRVSLARRETQRVMNSGILPQRPTQTSLDLSALNLNIPPLSAFPAPINGGREAQLVRRVKDLEEEVRAVRTENEKQKAMIAKFRERWDKLKESAKRKRSAKASGGSDNSSVRDQRIDEEPEAEFAAEEDAELSTHGRLSIG